MPKKGKTEKKPSRNAQEIEAFFKVHKGLSRSQKTFLVSFRGRPNISQACTKALISRQCFYDWKEKPEFKAAFEEIELGIDDEMQANWQGLGRFDWRACQAWLEKREKAKPKEEEAQKPHEATVRNIISEPPPKRYQSE